MTPRWHDPDSVSQYVAGTMSADALDAFEEHLLGCAECRAQVRQGIAISAAAAAPVGQGPSPVRSIWRSTTGRVVALAGIAVAVVLGIVTRSDPALRLLGAIEPAAFVAGAIRAPADSVAALVDSGMAAYAAGNYRAAAARLGRAEESDSSAGVRFFLGVALLMSDDNPRALAALQRAQSDITSPYAGEALLYAAKSLVRMELPDSAVAILERAIATGARSPALRALADSIKRR